MHDAITLANLIYAMPTKTSDDITRIFEEYKKERYPAVMESYKSSQILGKAIEKSFIGRLILFLMMRMPMWLWRLSVRLPFFFRYFVGCTALDH